MKLTSKLLRQHPTSSALLVTLFTLAAASAPAADEYQTRVVVRGLNRPTGIVAEGSKTLYITQLPTPGVAGPNGGMNRVDKINLGSGRITNLTMGEPEPTNMALDKHGHLYWTCKSAGVILERNRRGTVAPFLTGLTKPSGIAVDRWDRVYFTLLPTPGVPGNMGGANTVNVSDGAQIQVLTLGEPEPTDIAVTRRGEAYWTCKSAGVILKRAADGTVSLVLNGLHAPTGIALDSRGEKLYFTEVPTPGVAGGAGGMNRVSVYDLDEGELSAVNIGDPEPTDITVARNGRVYWTCSSAGVIVEARRICDYDEDDD
jgi:DNA-binding beta-propeller fold protein YncE